MGNKFELRHVFVYIFSFKCNSIQFLSHLLTHELWRLGEDHDMRFQIQMECVRQHRVKERQKFRRGRSKTPKIAI